MDRIPESFAEYIDLLPSLKEVTSWTLLRRWSHSEVWRANRNNGDSCIVKMGKDKNAREVIVYKDLLIPFGLDIPTIYASYKADDIGILIMKDLPGETLEDAPQSEIFIEAAKELATIRSKAKSAIMEGKLTNETYLYYYASKDQIINDLVYLSQQREYIDDTQATFLKKLSTILPPHMERLYRDFPLTLVHNDYYPKNLMKNNEKITVIDWASANLSPHLGDLYCFIRAAEDYPINSADLIHAYYEQTADSVPDDIEWQINMGGICWTIHALRQLFYYGVEAIPIAREWIPELVSDIYSLADNL
ncbi:aminoglycoside phosphotransferase family protein [Oceanobacillus jeddahense]|uniref:Aminoglycoside phosphotransferase family protein n=1 Tax=Oceanobacillus jeddahense TaxID=1462527 RepID=A0ABY5JT58_9BACI|nr:phosphotransferase [Oceanobacillus jeddahense]UUI03527.1 aminoglycoside phosphotransferase family protein [Oceanobacillus jeddahense]